MKFFLPLLCALLVSDPAFAGSYAYTALPPGFQAQGINNLGQISGVTLQVLPPCGRHTLAGCIDIPEIYSSGIVTSLNLPIQTSAQVSVYINDKGDLAGTTTPGPPLPFLIFGGQLVTGTLPRLNPDFGPVINGLNNAGDTIGVAFDLISSSVGFVTHGDSYTLLKAGAATGISNAGEVVGTLDSGGGFLYAGGVYSTIQVPGAGITNPVAINDAGEIAGSYSDGSGLLNGFVDNGGVFTTLVAPDGQPFIPVGLNDHGQLIGYATDNPSASFLATPQAVPEPISATLLGGGLAGLAALRRRAAH